MSTYHKAADAGKPSPCGTISPERAAERERLIALHREAWTADPSQGALATRVILRSDLPDIQAARRVDLLWVTRAEKLVPMSCRGCDVWLAEPAQIHGFAVTSAAIRRPRYSIVEGFCEWCASKGHTVLRTTAMDALRRDGLIREIIGEATDDRS
jgi:hypothetical protein